MFFLCDFTRQGRLFHELTIGKFRRNTGMLTSESYFDEPFADNGYYICEQKHFSNTDKKISTKNSKINVNIGEKNDRNWDWQHI